MKKEPKFFYCNECNVIIEEIVGSKTDYTCCGKELKALIPNTVDASKEKHIPTFIQNGNEISISVGSIMHPMEEAHSIEWVYLQTEKGSQRINLSPNDEANASFFLQKGDKAIAAYAYCNLHGLWKIDLQ